jgi:hypothetical protein
MVVACLLLVCLHSWADTYHLIAAMIQVGGAHQNLEGNLTSGHQLFLLVSFVMGDQTSRGRKSVSISLAPFQLIN